MRFCLTALVALCVAVWAGGAPGAQAETWTVVLTKKQAEGFEELANVRRNNAMAISPDGAWGFSDGYETADIAKQRAMQFCQGFLKPRKRDCLLFAVNGARVAPQTVQTRTVTAVYRPIDGKSASAFFGRSDFNFAGDRARALGELEAILQDPERQATLPKDAALKARLTGRSVMLTGRKGFAVYLGPQHAWHYAQANTGILRKRFEAWFVTPSGLVCLQNGVWENTGQQDGTKCLILSEFAQGRGVMSWDGTARTKRKAQLIAGDARFGGAK